MLYFTNTPNNGGLKMLKKLKLKSRLIIFLLLLFPCFYISTENLNDIYKMALENDPLLKASEATYRAGKEAKSQGISGLLPSLQVTGTTTWNEYRLEEEKLDEYNSNNYTGSISQPLFRLDKWLRIN